MKDRKGYCFGKRAVPFVLGVFVLLALPVYAANEDSRPEGADSVRNFLHQKDDSYIIRFSTTIPANTDVQLFGAVSGTAANWTTGINYSTTPAKSNGGRAFIYFQSNEGGTGSARLHYDYTTTVSTNTSPYLTQGQSYPPVTMPFVYQSTITVRSTDTCKISGFIVTEKNRR